jgi:threonine/homoserine/homoserine lactone efflux protein
MLDLSLTVFILTSLLIILSPGQDMVLVLSRSIARGTRAGVVTATGVATGLLGHTLLAALGLGALLQASEFAFSLMSTSAPLTYSIWASRRSEPHPSTLPAQLRSMGTFVRFSYKVQYPISATPK